VAKLVLLFLVVPLLDLWLLFSIGGLIGAWPTLGLVLGAAFLGVALGKREGRRVLGAWRDAVLGGRVPDEGLTSGILVLAGAALLVAPGVLTDLIGLSLIFPPTRRRIAAALRSRLERRFASGGALGGLGRVVAASESGAAGGARWSVQVVEIGGSLDGSGIAADAAGAARGETIDVEAESVALEDDGAARGRKPPQLPP
jgi:UPF0716 protein FxsA